MKTTGKILIGGLAALIIILTAVMVVAKVKVSSVVDIKSGELPKGSTEITEKEYDIDLRDSEVHNAEINSEGAGSIKITMTGGKLSGSVEGASSVLYYGEVSENTLRAQGVSSIKHKR